MHTGRGQGIPILPALHYRRIREYLPLLYSLPDRMPEIPLHLHSLLLQVFSIYLPFPFLLQHMNIIKFILNNSLLFYHIHI